MERREFLKISSLALAAMSIPYVLDGKSLSEKDRCGKYSLVILGDTHYDAEPAEVYHSLYCQSDERLNRIQRAEFARNGEMWRERCPRLVERAVRLVDDSTRMVLQTGDLIQGDCGSGDVHRKMLDDVMNMFKGKFGGLPFVTVAGNHDIRGTMAAEAYSEYMPARMSKELGIDVPGTTFSFNIGSDIYIVVDFNNPDDAALDKILDETNGARHTFVLIHAPVFPYDAARCRWIFHGAERARQTEARLHFRRRFAERNVICLCGHTHKTEFMDWYGDGGRITQMTMSSVWSNPQLDKYELLASGADEYGILRQRTREEAIKANGVTDIPDEKALFDEYRPGIKSYSRASSAGVYKLNVSDRHVYVDFYAGASESPVKRFIVR